MPVFDWAESPGTSMEMRPLVNATQFGDGYVASSPSGLNGPQQAWDIAINAANGAAATEIRDFIAPKLGWSLFDWTPPRHTAPLKWVCTAYSENEGAERDTWDIRLRFEQRFQP